MNCYISERGNQMNCTDEERFEQKYNEYGEMLYRIAFLFVANESDAEDILQEVFMKLLYERPNSRAANTKKHGSLR